MPGQLENRNKIEVWNGLEQVQEPRFYTVRQILTTGD
jgi:hypothetical protein